MHFATSSRPVLLLRIDLASCINSSENPPRSIAVLTFDFTQPGLSRLMQESYCILLLV